MTEIEVLGASMEHGILDGFEGALRIGVDHEDAGNRSNLIPENTQIVAEILKPDSFLCSVGERDGFGLHGRLCHEGLFLGRVGDRSAVMVKEITVARV